jgi:hypothetical protein
MRANVLTFIGVMATAAAAGCNGSMPMSNSDGGTMVLPDGAMTGGGTCAAPIDLATAGTTEGMSVTYQGTTDGRADELHPYGGCVMNDAAEAVFRYRVPANVQALRISTAGSAFDTVVYVRSNCSQAMGGMDLVCNNDSFDDAPHSTLFLTNLIEGQVVFIVVDGNRDTMDAPSSGAFVLTVTQVAFGTQGNPCQPEMEGSSAPRCEGALRCSEGGGADGSAICVPTVATGARCDQRGFENTCVEGARCVSDPSPPDGGAAKAVCATPGTTAGAACRDAEPRCNGPLVCGTGDAPMCVRVMTTGEPCDMTGATNQCPNGQVCSPIGGSSGPAICHAR